MFEETSSPNKPANIEDIFDKAEPPPSASAPVSPLASGPVASMPEWQDEPTSKSKRWLWYLLGGLVVVALGVGAWLAWSKFAPKSESTPTNEQLVAPTNEQSTVPTEPGPAVQGDNDGDGLTDAEEQELGTDPKRADSDEDGLFDKEEVKIYKTNPLNFDSDGDGYSDGQEVQNGYNPLGTGRLLQLPVGD